MGGAEKGATDRSAWQRHEPTIVCAWVHCRLTLPSLKSKVFRDLFQSASKDNDTNRRRAIIAELAG